MRSGYKELGRKLTERLKDGHQQPRRPPMAEEKRDEGEGDHIKFLFTESLTTQRDEMMIKFSQIFLRLPTTTNASTSSSHFGGMTPFKVQLNFDIPIFEGQIDVDALEKWVNMLEGYFSVYNFSNREKITFTLLKVLPHVKYWWETFYEQASTEEFEMFGTKPTWESFVDSLKGQYYPIGNYED